MQIDRQKCTGCGSCASTCLNNANKIIGKAVTTQEVLDEVLKDKIFYDQSNGGITITGGEPSYQPEFTLELLSLARDAGISLAMETCGIGSPDFYKRAIELGTTFLFDIKCLDPTLHKQLTGSGNAQILSNLQLLFDSGANVIIRLPLIPSCNDSDKALHALAKFLNTHKGKYRYAEIMPYHTLGTGKAQKIGVAPAHSGENATAEDIARWCKLFNACGIDVKVSNEV